MRAWVNKFQRSLERKYQLMSLYTEDKSFAVMLNIIENDNSS